jgi:hypothetical protein
MFSVVCRTDENATLRWAYVAERYPTRLEAEESARVVRLMGYSALVFLTRYVRAMGLPKAALIS